MRKILQGICLAVALAALAPGDAFARCGESSRISYSNASCLDATWVNNASEGRPRLEYNNMCGFSGRWAR